MVTRHEFLADIHAILKPTRYLEVGVQYGTSLDLAVHSQVAIGVDPAPLTAPKHNQQIHIMTADDFFLYHMMPEETMDFCFIDGSHLFEDAFRDFINIELHSNSNTVVVFDDVLPMTQEMTSRTMVPGYWTGDVWKVVEILRTHRPDLQCILVDTEPTGAMVVLNLDRGNQTLPLMYSSICETWLNVSAVPESILSRESAQSTESVLKLIATWLTSTEVKR